MATGAERQFEGLPQRAVVDLVTRETNSLAQDLRAVMMLLGSSLPCHFSIDIDVPITFPPVI